MPSRRLGRSLGIDLVPAKTCSYDCVFCQVGATTDLTEVRREYVPTDDVIAEISAWIKRGGAADRITLAGSGEPTLHSRFGDVLDAVHRLCAIPTAVMSNGSLFWLPDVRSAALHSDMVKVSLSAWDDASFKRINRPATGLTFEAMVGGLQVFRREYARELWVEVFVLKGINDRVDAMRSIAALVRAIRPDRVQMNTVIRPPADSLAAPVGADVLERLAGLFDPRAEVIGDFSSGENVNRSIDGEAVVALVGRHPCTAEDLRQVFGQPVEKIAAVVGALILDGRVREERRDGTIYYRSSGG